MVNGWDVIGRGLVGLSLRAAGSFLATVNETLDEQIAERRNAGDGEANSDTQSSGFGEVLNGLDPGLQEGPSEFVDCNTLLYNTAPEEPVQNEPTNPAEFSSFKDRFVIVEFLGSGGFGIVYKCLDRVENNYCAVKFIPNWSGSLDEVKGISCLRHENIHQYFNADIQKTVDIPEIWNKIRNHRLNYCRQEYTMNISSSRTKDDETKEDKSLEEAVLSPNQFILVIKTKLCMGSLAKFLSSNPQNRNPGFMIPRVRQIASGLHYLHSLTPKMIHRDLKPANILVTNEDTLQITDFGLNIAGGKDDTNYGGGTNLYRSPESSGKVDPQLAHKMDLWSLGLTAYEMFVPMGNNNVEMFKKLKENQIINEDLICDLRELIINLTQRDPSQRMEASSVISHLHFYQHGLSDFEGTRTQLMRCLSTGDETNLRMVIRTIWEPFADCFEREPNHVPSDFEWCLSLIEKTIAERPNEVKFANKFIKNFYRDSEEESEQNILTKALDSAIEHPEMLRPIFTKVFATERLALDEKKTNKQRVLKLVNHLGLVFNLIMEPYMSDSNNDTPQNSGASSSSM